MTPTEAEKLLGGVATGTLTEAEKSLLYGAALHDQVLFDALADEEALRELLADPAVRTRLLAVLVPKATPWWRKPAVLGLAATLFLAVTTQVVLRRTPLPEPTLPAAAPSTPRPETAIPVESGGAQPGKAMEKAAPSPKHLPTLPAPAEVGEDRDLFRADAEAKPLTLPERSLPQSAPAAVAGGVLAPTASSDGPKQENAQDLRDLGLAKREKQMAREAPAKAKADAGSATAMGAVVEVVASTQNQAAPPPPPTWELERLTDGRLRLRVTRTGGQLYALLRPAQGAPSLLSPQERLEGTRRHSTYEWAPQAGSALDLYLLGPASPDPLLLPAAGPFEGWRQRVWPTTDLPPGRREQ